MLSEDDLEWARNEDRWKAQMDHNSFMNALRRARFGYDFVIGEQIGRIHTCEYVLQRPETPREELRKMSLEDLIRRGDELEALAHAHLRRAAVNRSPAPGEATANQSAT